MSKRNVYIAGPITGVPGVKERFADGCNEVATLGYTPICPLDVPKAVKDDFSEEVWLVCIKADLHALLECDGIYLLRGWENSRGARLEKLIADGLGMFILYQDERSEDNGRREDRRAAGEV